MRGQLIERGEDTWLIRIFLGRDENGKKLFHNETFRGKKKKAEKRVRDILQDIDQGVYVKPSALTLNGYLDQWLEVIKARVSERTYTDYKYLLDHYVKPVLGGKKLLDVGPLDIQGLYSKMQADGLGPRIIRYTHTVLSAALKKAVRWKLLGVDPTVHAELPKQVRKEMQAFSPEEASRFLQAAAEDPHGVLFAFALTTGTRPEEYLALQWKDIDWKQGTVIVRRTLIWRTRGGGWYFGETKTSRSRRTIPLPASIVRQLSEHKRSQAEERLRAGADWQKHDLVFTTAEGGPLSIQNLTRRHFKPILKRAGLSESVRLYDLRHSMATLLLSSGENPKIVSERLGHASVAITLDTYSHVLPHMQQGASEKLESMLFGQ